MPLRSRVKQVEKADDPDAALVVAAQAGDQQALDDLLRRHFDRIYGICRRITGNDADAADAAQEAMLAVVRGLDHFDGRAKFSTWVYRVASNACLDELRRRNRRPLPGLTDETATTQVDTPMSQPMDDQIADRLDIDEALQELGHDFRVAVVLRDHLGMEYTDIADQLEIPLGTVQSRISRGRTELARVLGNKSGPHRSQRPR